MLHRLRRHRADLLALLILVVLPLIWFAPVLLPSLTGRTLLPYDNLYAFEPWHSLQPGLIPHNGLLSDLVLENAVWKLHIRRSLAAGELPLWNPQIFTGLPFLAAGQSSALYPLSLLFYVLPLEAAYGWFTALQIALAGVNMYVLGRVLRLHPIAALVAGVVFMFSGFLIGSVVFTMFLAAVVWLPLLLALIEIIVRKQEEKGLAGYSPIPYVAAGAATIGVMTLAGHPELIYYTLLVAALYAVFRLLAAWRTLTMAAASSFIRGALWAPSSFSARRLAGVAAWLLVMAALGLALGAVQLLPLLELVPQNFRAGSAGYAEVVGWAWPLRQVLTFWLPDIFGNPAHHRWFDLWQGQWMPATVNALGEATHTIFWGVKNYVEGANYLSIAAWALAAIAVANVLIGLVFKAQGVRLKVQSPPPIPLHDNANPKSVWFFAGLALLSLLFAFGTPLYALLFYGLPGWNQLHSPFRWVFPYTLSMAVLAGMGSQTILDFRRWVSDSQLRDRARVRWLGRAITLIAAAALAAGVAALLVVAGSYFWPRPFLALSAGILAGSDLARMAFADAAMFWGYQALNLARFGLFATLTGLLILAFRFSSDRTARIQNLAWVALLAVIVLDLYAAHGRFNPAAQVALSPLTPEGTPPVVQFINAREGIGENPKSPWRFTTFNVPGEKTFNANAGMYYGWQDLRGYDSIIPRQYAELMARIAPQDNELLYNRIAPLYADQGGDVYAGLNNPLLDLLNVKYVLTEHYIPNPGWEEIYRDNAVGVYENREVFPRAFIVPEARVVAAADQPLTTADLRQVVFLDETPSEEHALAPAGPQTAEAHISRYTPNNVFVDVNLGDRGWLVLGDAYFPGWKAFIRPFGAGEGEEQELTIYRADGALRAVYLPTAGQWTVRFTYSPMSFKLGLYVSFLAGMTLLLLGFYWLWGKFYRPEATVGEVRTVAKNTLAPLFLSLMNKAVDFAFAMLYVRLLGPAGTGSYAFVVAFYGFFEIISRYGLGTLLTRDVAADKHQSSRYLTNVLSLRTLLWLVSLPVMALATFGFWAVGQVDFLDASSIGRAEIVAIGIFAISMIFANYTDAFSSMFLAFEKMEYPAGMANATALLKVALGAAVLLMGWGFVGLAAVSLVVNIVAMLWLFWLMRITLFRPEWKWDWSLQRWMFRISGPLMINHLLATIFWRIDVWLLRPMAGAVSVGLYSVGLKYLDGLNIIPSVFTMAVFPLMSRYAQAEGDTLRRAYVLSLRLLVMVSLPIAVAVTFLAEPLVWLVGGAQYLDVPLVIHLFGNTFVVPGGSDLALQVIIWSIPIGFVNSVTQYVLIAVHQQHYLTRAFIIGVVFNIAFNLVAIPALGYVGAALVTILSEFSLLFPFYFRARRSVGSVPWLRVFGPPALAGAGMAGVIFLLHEGGLNIWLATGLGALAYLVGVTALGGLAGEDMAAVVSKLPLGPLQRYAARRAGV